MKKHFYSNIINIQSIHAELKLLDIGENERHELIAIVETSIHHLVIDVVLSELSEKDKKEFLKHVVTEKHDDLWKLLNEKTANIKEKIRAAVDGLIKDLYEDIKETKEKNK